MIKFPKDSKRFQKLYIMKKKEKLLLDYLRQNAESPTVAQMKKAIGTKSNLSLYKILDSLEDQGIIKRQKGLWRNIELLSSEPDDDWIRIPLLGTVAAGHPIEAILIPESMRVPATMLKKGRDYFGLKVRGDSMKDVHILDGDRIVVQKSEIAQNGDIVVALIDGESATVKTFRKVGRVVKLIPANSEFEAIEVDAERVTIQGIYVGLIRFCKR